MNEQNIQRGFNSGYRLRQSSPDLAQHFQALLKDRQDEYATGFNAGVAEYEKELDKLKSKSPIKRFNLTKPASKDRSRDKDRSKDWDRDDR